MSKEKTVPVEFIPKPSSVLFEEFNQRLVALVNECGLPKFCIIPVMDDVLRQLREAAAIEYQRDFDEWQKKLNEKPADNAQKGAETDA